MERILNKTENKDYLEIITVGVVNNLISFGKFVEDLFGIIHGSDNNMRFDSETQFKNICKHD